jgi:hypothetical protein
MTMPDFLVVGAMRSGTSSLARDLRAHPDVYLSEEKELHFFDLRYERGTGWYEAQFVAGESVNAVGEATQTYMYDPEALARIADRIPDVRLIAILRDPVERAYSHYWLNRSLGKEELDFGDAIEREASRLRSNDKLKRFTYSYVDRGRYLEQLERVDRLFPASHVHILLFEDLRDRPVETFGSICRFLGIPEGAVETDVLTAPVNRYQQFRSVGLRRIYRRLDGKAIAARIALRALGRANRIAAGYPPMERRSRERVEALLEAQLPGLRTRLQRDLCEWVSSGQPQNVEHRFGSPQGSER